MITVQKITEEPIMKILESCESWFRQVEEDGLGNSETYYHHTDHLGGGNVVTDSSGAIVSVLDYHPFGSTRVEENRSARDTDIKFTGQREDDESGLYYYHARYYDSGVGRFTGVDPASRFTPEKFLSDPQQLNLYSYVRNSPVSHVDPTGEALFLHADLTQQYLKTTEEIERENIENLDFWSAVTPGVGDGRDFMETLSGRDAVYGNQLSTLERGLTAVSLLIGGFVSGREVRVATNAIKVRTVAKRYHWGDVGTLAEHYGSHGKNVGANSMSEYAEKAQEFLKNKSRYEFKVDSEGVTRVFDSKSKTIGSYNPNGSTRTFLKKDGSDAKIQRSLRNEFEKDKKWFPIVNLNEVRKIPYLMYWDETSRMIEPSRMSNRSIGFWGNEKPPD